jgi:poly(A) polymerase
VIALQRLLHDEKVARLLAALAATGGETRVVGGAVRDALLGLPPGEIDLATTATPDRVVAAAEAAGLKAVPTGIEHGTVTLIVDGTPFEVTTLREDVETFGRAAKVRFGADFERDALRRDFTVNALSLGVDGRLHDYAGGLEDLSARRVRFIGDPAQRIAEDYLRILRFFRFHASLGGGDIDAAGLAAAVAARDSLKTLSPERLRAELLKLLVAPRAPAAARLMAQSGLLAVVLGFSYPARLEKYAQIAAPDEPPRDAVLRLAALAVATVEDADRLRKRLRLSNAEHQRLSRAARALVDMRRAEAPPPAEELTRILFVHERRAALDALALAQAESRAHADDIVWRGAQFFLRGAASPVFPVRSQQLVAAGVTPGPALGAALKKLQALWIRAGFPQDPAVVQALVAQAAGGVKTAP